MSRGESVFQAMGAAGILRDVATDAADRLRRGVGCVEIFLRRYAAGDIEIDDSGFGDYTRVGQVNFEDAVHARQADDDAVFDRERAAAQAGSRAARDKRDAFTMADAEDRLDLLRGFGEQHTKWHDAKIRQRIAFIGVEFFGGGNQAARTDNSAQFLNDA